MSAIHVYSEPGTFLPRSDPGKKPKWTDSTNSTGVATRGAENVPSSCQTLTHRNTPCARFADKIDLKAKMLSLLSAPGAQGQRAPLVIAKGLAPEKYALHIDGKNIIIASAEGWTKGVAVFHPDKEQVERLHRTIIDKN
jgi:hypothetical protein